MESVGLELSRKKTEYLQPEGNQGDTYLKKYDSEERVPLPKFS